MAPQLELVVVPLRHGWPGGKILIVVIMLYLLYLRLLKKNMIWGKEEHNRIYTHAAQMTGATVDRPRERFSRQRRAPVLSQFCSYYTEQYQASYSDKRGE